MNLSYMLFYGGIIVSVIDILAAAVFFILFYINKIKLNSEFDREYGEEAPVKIKTLKNKGENENG